jgi:RND family efflux transporter MFP subunit
MKFQKLSLIVFATLLLAACTDSDKKDLESKKKLLADDKGQLKELTAKIETLEKEIAKMDTSFKVDQKSKLVTAEVLKKENFKHYIEVQGNVDAEENVTALPQQPGLVTEINVKVGDHVTKGQLLGLTATTAAVSDQLQAAQVQQGLANTAYEKQKALWDQKIGSEIQFLQAKTQKEAAEKNIDALKSQLEMTKIIAPITGTVDAVNLRIGDMAAPSQMMPGIRIVNGNKLKVKARLADSDFGKIKQGDVVNIEFPDINKTIEAPVSYVSNTIDARSRTFGIEVKLNNDHNEYAANLIAKLKINDEILKNVLVVPSNVIQRSADGAYVLTAGINNGIKTAHKIIVTTGAEYNGETVITSGLSEGDKIITFGYSEVVDGQRIDF